MKPQKGPFVVEIKHNRRDQKSPAHSIWGDIDMSAYGLPENNTECSAEREISIKASGMPESAVELIRGQSSPKRYVDDEYEVTAANDVSKVKPSAPSSVSIVVASGLHYVRVYDNGAKHELVGPFRTREQAQTEAAKWIEGFKAAIQQ